MRCFIENIVTDGLVTSDIKALIPDAGMRRRMSQALKSAVATAVECVGGVDRTTEPDAIITATGLGCLADSERFLRNMIARREEQLNPTPFIQSTFNTVGGQIALLRHNHAYNMTYVNRDHGFDDALLDAWMRIADGESRRVLVGVFDEQTPSQYRIMERMGLWRRGRCDVGAIFMTLTDAPSGDVRAELVRLEMLMQPLDAEECRLRYADCEETVVLRAEADSVGLFPLLSARLLAEGVGRINGGAREVVIYNEHGDKRPAIMVLRCVGC